ncbi:hypothetical protein H0H93_011101 [Arthromyces matolae]|nr:hypothetical protein H0H93_011101 [Arthromyces matolae]
MQRPTLDGVRIRSSQDVHRIFYAVQMGRLKMLERRLDNDEREALRPGCIYVWEERGSRNADVTGEGMDRFTEGKQWGPSRVRDDFLFYTQKATTNIHAWDRLIKQTYSAWADTPAGRRKWHLNAYFTDNTIDNLRTIDDIPACKDLEVPSGIFECAKSATKSKPKEKPVGKRPSKPTLSPSQRRSSSSFSAEPGALAQPYITKEHLRPIAIRPAALNPLPSTSNANVRPIEDLSHNTSQLTSTASSSRLEDDDLPHYYPSLPPVETFLHGRLPYSRTPSPSDSVHGSLTSYHQRSVPDNDGDFQLYGGDSSLDTTTRALAPIYGPKHRLYVRDPLDDQALRSLPR